MKFLATPDDDSGQAADTGSAMHRAAQAMHKKESIAASLKAMQEDKAKYPLADLNDAAAMFLNYASDPRNSTADFVCVEQAIAFDIAPAKDDPTQAPIKVIGTLDQVRRKDGKLFLWDIKTSKKDGPTLLSNHIFQAAAYCIGASILLNAPVHPGGLILPRKYKAGAVATSPAFWHFAWSFDDIEQILEPIRHKVSLIRRGLVTHMPNEGCNWCPGRSPDLCLPKLRRTLRELPVVDPATADPA